MHTVQLGPEITTYIASKAAVWTLGQGTNSLQDIKNSSLAAAPSRSMGLHLLEDASCAKQQELYSLAACVRQVCALCMCMSDEEDSLLWQHSVPSLHLNAPKTSSKL